MHVGHLRGTIIGDALARVMQALGHRVIRQNHVGDWGTQFGMLIAHLEDLREADSKAELSTELSDLETFYRHAKQRFDAEPDFADRARRYVVRLQQGDPQCLAMWQQFIEESLRHCEAVYEMLGVLLTRDDLKAESSYNNDLNDIINALDEKELLTESEGAQCVFLDEFVGKDGSPLPAIVQKRDGGFLYATTDLAAVRHRCQTLGADRVLYVVDARQGLHFQQVFAIARQAGFAPEDCSLEHIAYGTMMGEDGKPFKTRSGDTVKLQDLLEEASERAYRLVSEKNADLDEAERRNIARIVGAGAVKYYDLARNRNSDYVFDWSAMLSFDGNTAPYMLYAYARICSVLRKLDQSGTAGAQDDEIRVLEWEAPEERALVLKLLQLPEAVQLVAQDGYPNHLCQYLFELAGLFMRFYESCPILKADTERRRQRLAIARLSAQNIRNGLELLGIPTLERM
jgi:arginyl-tRNA synthetase